MLADGSALNFGHVKDCANGTYACTFVPLVGGRSVIKVRSRALKDRPDHARLPCGTAGRPHRRGTSPASAVLSSQVTLGGVPIKDSPFAMVADRQDLVKLRPER
jgi:hypothetical protein